MRSSCSFFSSHASTSSGPSSSHHSNGSNDSNTKNNGTNQSRWWRSGAASAVVASTLLFSLVQNKNSQQPSSGEEPTEEPVVPGRVIEGLPEYTMEEVAAHKTALNEDDRIWATYRDGVYDITDFIDAHPGTRTKIMLAAGGRIDPFWAYYRQHNTEQISEMIESLRIGNLAPKDRLTAEEIAALNPYYREPTDRNQSLVVRSLTPFNAETPPEIMAELESGITPNSVFYIRHHLPVPHVDPTKWTLHVAIEGEQPKQVELSLDDLRTKFEKHEVTVTIQCAGNRRDDMDNTRRVQGLGWGVGGIGTAKWAGAKLVDVLRFAGFSEEDIAKAKLEHIQFEGLDRDFERAYGASIPIHKALDPNGEVILAYEMNGVEIPADHGYPVRAVVPGVVGARSVKWLGSIKVTKNESPSQWQQRDYKGFNPSVDWENITDRAWETAPAIQELPVQSAILKPTTGSVLTPIQLDDGRYALPVKGYAWSGGGRGIVRVDVSVDGGHKWYTSDLKLVDPSQPLHKRWAWTIWSAQVPITPEIQERGKAEIICKAVDASYNVQPDTVEPIWNLRGVLNNAWHRVHVDIATPPTTTTPTTTPNEQQQDSNQK